MKKASNCKRNVKRSLTLISGELGSPDEEMCGASAHSDYGMITLLATDGVPGLQACFLTINLGSFKFLSSWL